ncbi:MAG: metallophosphoesterase, partial [Methylocystaceae bacterium]
MAELFFLLIVILIYGGLNFYLYLRVQFMLTSWLPGVAPAIFTVFFWLVAGIFLLAQVSRHLFGQALPVLFVKIGDYWLAVMFYGVMLAAAADLFRLGSRYIPWLPVGLKDPRIVSLVITLMVLLVVLGGAWNSRHPVITHYDLTIDKPSAGETPLHIVMVSDLHLGVIVDRERLVKLVTTINNLHADLVVMPGDVIDEDLQIVIDYNMGDELKQIKSRYGVYACLGNHEYYSGRISEVDQYLQKAGITLLRDRIVLVNNRFYLAGRSLKSENPMADDKSIRLKELLAGTDQGKPILVMDHVPSRINEAASAGVDLLFCGHTHLGQMWPLNYITRRVFLADYGLYQQASLQAVISNGVGT